jgi:hypothetical protein
MLYSQRSALGWYGARLWRFESAIVSFLTGINFGIRTHPSVPRRNFHVQPVRALKGQAKFIRPLRGWLPTNLF